MEASSFVSIANKNPLDFKRAVLDLKDIEKEPNITTTTIQKIEQACDEIKDLLIKKNKKYGDTALNPVRIFSSVEPIEQLKVRIDDKLGRLSQGNFAEGEDTILDLLGYLILLRISLND